MVGGGGEGYIYINILLIFWTNRAFCTIYC